MHSVNSGRKHLFHTVDPSPWPFATALGASHFTPGLAFYMHRINYGFFVLFIGFLILLLVAFPWFRDISTEATLMGYHTRVVRIGSKFGFSLFIASEIMLFFGFFRAFFHASLCPAIELGTKRPPSGISLINVYDYPLYNTFLLIISGFAVTRVHRGIALVHTARL